MHTVQFRGGDYSSRDVDVETLFNDQKNEFGITVDALSWIPVRSNNNIVDNYRLGLLSTPNLHTRYLSLLYVVPHTNVCTIQPQEVGHAVGRAS